MSTKLIDQFVIFHISLWLFLQPSLSIANPFVASGAITAVIRVCASKRVLALGTHSLLPSKHLTIIHPEGSPRSRICCPENAECGWTVKSITIGLLFWDWIPPCRNSLSSKASYIGVSSTPQPQYMRWNNLPTAGAFANNYRSFRQLTWYRSMAHAQ